MSIAARDKALLEIYERRDISVRSEHHSRAAMEEAYEAGYQACRDRAIRILSARGEHDYE